MEGYMQGRLGFNPKNERFGLLISDLWEVEGFHCGTHMEVYDSDTEKWIPTRIEMSWPDKKYYLVDTPFKGDDLEGLRVRISK